MYKKGILLVAVTLLSVAGLVQAQTDEIHGTMDVSYLSRFIWRGFDMYPERHSAIQPSIDLDLFGTGFGLNVLYSRANSGGFEDEKWLPITLYYQNKLWEAECYAMNYKAGWVYYNYPDNSSGLKDLQEAFGSFSFPKICPFGTVPSYTIVRMWSAGSSSAAHTIGNGWLHVFSLAYDVPMNCISPELPAQNLHFTAETVYNDGVGKLPASTATVSEHDWSHAVFGVSTGFEVTNDLTFTPGVYYQSSWEDTVNDSDEYWTKLSLTYKF